jgi:O-methyltransferase
LLTNRLFAAVRRNVPRSVRRTVRSAHEEFADWRLLRGVDGMIEAVRPFTMIPDEWLRALARQVNTVQREQIPGDFVECGVWRGGASFLMAQMLDQAPEQPRRVWLFDSFEGLPAPKSIDGPAALAYAINRESPRYLDNCTAHLADVQQTARTLGLEPRTIFVKGWFEETLPVHKPSISQIAILRIDADWHASVKCCLDSLYDAVAPGGYVILDDYDTWDGCAVAIHEFLGERKLAHRIERDGCVFFRKQ